MLQETPTSEPQSLWKRPIAYGGPILLIVALYAGWTVFSRWYETRQLEQHARESAAQKEAEQDRRTVEMMGGSELSIQGLYGNPQIHRGQTAQLCYGVANAKTVTLDPPVANVWPSYTRCIDVKPTHTTTYKLTAFDASGKSVSQSFTVKVD